VFEGVEHIHIYFEDGVEVRSSSLLGSLVIEQSSKCEDGVVPNHHVCTIRDFIVYYLHQLAYSSTVKLAKGEVESQ
jgi:hypothetical protein